jgi:hypothetical protein
MAKVKITGHASGTGVLTITAPNTSTDRTITLPDATGTLLNSDGSAASLTAIPAANITGTLPAIDGSSLTGIAGIPTGVIAMWHGAAGAIPSGWVICDGNNSTPNLTDKFIKSTGTANATGGSATSGATTLATSQIPSHQHYVGDVTPNSSGTLKAVYGAYGAGQQSGLEGGGGSHTHPQSEPVFFSLIFIMKT